MQPLEDRAVSNRIKYFAGAGAVLLAAFAVWFFAFRDTAPPEATLEDAVGSVTSTTGAGAGDAPLDGTWTIDTTAGGGVVENGSFVGYRVQEELANIGAKTAVGRTTSLSGSFTFQGTALLEAGVAADLTRLQSDSGGRDRQMRSQALETDSFPEARFTLTEPVDLGTVPASGESFAVDAVGDLTIHGVTRSVTVPIEGQLVGDTVVVVGRITVAFADYDIDQPRAVVVLSVADEGEMEFQLFLTRS
jgi:polyisoprenoid-binding protein YceI